MRKILLLVIIVIAASFVATAQRYIIKFKDKAFSSHTLSNPSTYLSDRAILRRQRFSISIDSTDLPVTERYLDSLRSVPGVTVLNPSKWLNHVSVFITDPNALTTINNFPFVVASSRIANRIRTNVDQPSKELENLRQSTPPP